MSQNTILLLQSILIFLQMVNAAIGTSLHLAPEWSVIVAAGVGAFQYYVNHLGNQSVPAVQPKPTEVPVAAPAEPPK
jgi:hypothetical protein